MLYRKPLESLFLCRKCQDLTYQLTKYRRSQYEQFVKATNKIRKTGTGKGRSKYRTYRVKYGSKYEKINMRMNPKPFNTGYLPKQDGNKVYFTQYGNPKGEAVVSLHGGPGSKSKPKYVKEYELEKYHIIAFDQRGCGESTPSGEIKSNTTQDLITDIERLRSRFKIDKWYVAGGSWGATLALVYAETYPKSVKGLLLSSVFLARPRDVKWAFTEVNGIERLFPDLWEQRLKFLNKYKVKSNNAAKLLLKKIKTSKPEMVKEIVAGVSNWEGNLMNAQEDLNHIDPEDISDSDISAAKVFLHYEANNFFLKPDQLLKNANKIRSIPTIIVHGRYDVLCPVEQTWELQKDLVNVETIILPTSNHKLTAEGEVAKRLAFNYFLSKQKWKQSS